MTPWCSMFEHVQSAKLPETDEHMVGWLLCHKDKICASVLQMVLHFHFHLLKAASSTAWRRLLNRLCCTDAATSSFVTTPNCFSHLFSHEWPFRISDGAMWNDAIFLFAKNGHSWHCQFSSSNHPKSQDVTMFLWAILISRHIPNAVVFFIYILHIRFTISRQKLKSHHLNGRHIPQRVQPQLASPTLNRRWTWATMGCTRNASKNRSRFWPHVSWWKYD